MEWGNWAKRRKSLDYNASILTDKFRVLSEDCI